MVIRMFTGYNRVSCQNKTIFFWSHGTQFPGQWQDHCYEKLCYLPPKKLHILSNADITMALKHNSNSKPERLKTHLLVAHRYTLLA